MRVCTDNNLTGQDNSFTHQLMADATTDIGELHRRSFCKTPEIVLECCRCAIVGRCYVIELDMIVGVFSEPVPAHVFPCFQGKNAGTVMGICPVDFPVDIFTSGCSKNSFGKGTHAVVSRCALRISFWRISGVILHFCSECSLTRSSTRHIWASERSSPSDAMTCSSAFLPVCFPKIKCRSPPTRSGGKYSYVAGSSRIAAMWMPLSCENASSPVTGL